MGDAGFFKGTSADQDARFSDKQKKLLRSMHFPSEFNQKIDMKKVNLKVIKGWMAQRISQFLGIEDEVVVEYASGMLEEDSPDPKMMQINLQGFLERNSQAFVLELWKLLISAQKSLGGIPQQFLDQTKEELLQAKRLKDVEMGRLREQEDKERAVADEVRRKAQAIRDANRPKASSLGNNDTANSRTTLQNGPREDHQISADEIVLMADPAVGMELIETAGDITMTRERVATTTAAEGMIGTEIAAGNEIEDVILTETDTEIAATPIGRTITMPRALAVVVAAEATVASAMVAEIVFGSEGVIEIHITGVIGAEIADVIGAVIVDVTEAETVDGIERVTSRATDIAKRRNDDVYDPRAGPGVDLAGPILESGH
ncbi:hypothetical protein BGZ99_010078 [Dissophora globulifera]|uniref:PWI domain-containing protein n=1 Tax=Dissophora globulifera TaxID=979702 RepID=A0A9P6UME2_9FUNG|nr:hypothetical protein BGZ99_010078 [Dissophora globulifera]